MCTYYAMLIFGGEKGIEPLKPRIWEVGIAWSALRRAILGW
jgi:hypothetical protein